MRFLIYYIVPFAIVLGVLIFIHELGHFLVAKAFRVKVLKFSLGFGPKLLGRRVGETEYLLSAVPLGGYVKMLGESEDDEQPLTPEEEQRSFAHQHVLKRIAIVAAGPAFNLLLAVFIFILFYLFAGTQVMTPEVGQVREDSPAYRAGLLKGDLIVSINGIPITSWPAIKEVVENRAGERVEVVVKRGESLLNLWVTPEDSVVKNLFGEEVRSALIGIVAAGKFRTVELSPWGSVKEGLRKTGEIIYLTCLTILKLFQRVVSIKTVGGPILIGQMAGELAQESVLYLIPFMALISVNLAVLNLLPVPVLDGGVILFLLVELLVGRPLSFKKRELAQKLGLALLITLMAVVMYNDLARLME